MFIGVKYAHITRVVRRNEIVEESCPLSLRFSTFAKCAARRIFIRQLFFYYRHVCVWAWYHTCAY